MSLVFKTPLNAKNTTTRGSQNIDSPSGCNLVEGSAEYNENGEYTLAPESADGFSSVAITVDVPSDVNNQSKTVTISENGESTVTYDEDYTGLSSVAITVDVEPDLEAKTATYTSNDTYTISPSQGKDGLSGVTVTVNVPSDVHNQEKSATPTTSSQEVTPDSGYSGLSKVTVSAVTAAIDANISAGNIKKDVEILGVTGNYDPQPDLEAKTVNSSTVQQIVTPTAGKDGLSSVTVEPYTLQAKSATPTTSQQVIEPDNDKDGLSSVTVAAVTSSIDANISAGNIKKDVTILGVIGNFDPQPNLDSVNVTPTTSAQQITPSSPVDGYNEINVAAVTSAIDANIAAGNIKEGVTILGVQGTVHEGITPTGNINITDTNSTNVANYATAQVVDANLAAGNIKSGVTILGVAGSYSPTVSLQNKTATPTTSQQVISADSGYDGLDEVTVSAVTSAIDANIAAGNIKDGVTILGVTGTYSGGGGGTNVPDWSSIGFTSAETQYIVDEVAESALAKTTYIDQDQAVPFSTWKHLRYWPSGKYEWATYQDYGSYAEILGDITVYSNVDSNYEYFYNCPALTHITSLSFKKRDGDHSSFNPTGLKYCFGNCKALLAVPAINTSAATRMDNMFSGCESLTTIPTLDLTAATNTTYMFANCKSLQSVSFATNTGANITDASYMFQGCSSLTSAPAIPSTALTNVKYIFEGCFSLTTIPTLDYSHITNGGNIARIVRGCSNLTSIGNINSSSVKYFDQTLYPTGFSGGGNLDNLVSVGTIDCTSVDGSNWIGVFTYGTGDPYPSLTTFGGFVNLGKAFKSSTSNHNMNISGLKHLTKTSVMNVINNLSAPDDTSVVDASITLSAESYALLDASDIAIATAKNWSVISA